MSQDSIATGRWAEVFAPRYLPATTILALGVALLAFNAFLTSTAMPTAVEELGGVSLIAWALTLFLVFAIMGGAGAALAKQVLGARVALLVSAGMFLAGSLIVGLAGSMEMVLAGRALQGLGEGLVAAICFALIPELFPARLVPKVFGMEAMVWAIAAFGGPVVAGLLTEFVSWRAAFLVSVSMAVIFAGMVLAVVPNSTAGDRANVDFPGVRLLLVGGGIMAVAVASLVPPLLASALLVAAAALLVGTVLLDKASRTRLMPPDAFWHGSVIGNGLWVTLLMPVAGATSAVYLVLLLQQMWGYGPTLAGAVAAVLALAWSGAAIVVANVSDNATRMRLIRLGPALLTLGLAGVLAGLLSGQIALVLLAQIAIGASYGMSNSSLYVTLMGATTDQERDRVAALVPTTQSAGNAIGAALAGLAANLAGYASASSSAEFARAIIPVFAVGAGTAALAVIAAARMTQLMSLSPAYEASEG
ncbi:MAG: MFS transporter [Cypionkella sp.]